jgi:hypothetical protein
MTRKQQKAIQAALQKAWRLAQAAKAPNAVLSTIEEALSACEAARV